MTGGCHATKSHSSDQRGRRAFCRLQTLFVWLPGRIDTAGIGVRYSLFTFRHHFVFFVQAVLEQENFANRILAGVIRLFIGTERSP